ncbi:hypothetical protein ACHAXT_004641 [Thalassiosira profunda]
MGKQHERRAADVSRDGGGGHSGGIDIGRIVEASDDAPSQQGASGSASPKQRRRKKRAPKEGKKVLVKDDTVGDQERSKGSGLIGTKCDTSGPPSDVFVLKPGPQKSSEISVLKPGTQKKKVAVVGARRGRVANNSEESYEVLKQKLFEATRDLEKENNTREMLENKVKALSLELKSVKDTLGEDKHYCIGSLKQELQFEQRLRLDVQNDVQGLEQEIASQQKKMKALEKQVESEQKTSDALRQKVESVMDEVDSEKSAQSFLQTRLSLEEEKNKDLQKRLQRECAANVAIQMELQSNNNGAAMRERVQELEEQLRVERSVAGRYRDDEAECTAVKMELQAVKKQLRNLQHNQDDVEGKADVAAEIPLVAKCNTVAEDEKDRLIRKLRRTLQETRMKLKNERRKNAAAAVSKAPQKKALPPKRSLSGFVVARTNTQQHAGLIPIVQSPPSGTSMPTRAVEASLPGSTEATTEPAPAPSSPDAPTSLFHFEDDDLDGLEDQQMALHDELTFLQSAYDADEILIEDGKVTHYIELETGSDANVVTIAVAVSIPNNYPASGVLGVKASLHLTRCPSDVYKCAKNALAELEEICVWEAQANEGQEAIHSVFSVASGWAHLDWHNVLAKELSISFNGEEESASELCVALIYTHHLVDADKIQCVKKNASKLSLGGYIFCGKPGLILVEGLEEDCDHFLEALALSKKVFSTGTFKSVGKACIKGVGHRFFEVSAAEDGRCGQEGQYGTTV